MRHPSGGPLPDIGRPGIALLLCGINPGTTSGTQGCHFAGPSNRFWRALADAGLTSRRLRPSEQDLLPAFGIGLTNLCPRTTTRASEVSADELRGGAARLRRLAADWRPRVVAVLGVTAFRVAFERPDARVGPQNDPPGWWVLHNPSGLNAHATPAEHAQSLRTAGRAAGLIVDA
ncbi:mismatch-specific DNA-glycosylase [Egibacter rhizosphaerae]|uniref:Mismatch-specific DNA-glycosylase n=1 Tax=Egibacter rhizosphaerae TaxID=1670831 RepID=A0A411YL61_9ACTN|nr:mismatch-specific DNA-glycosylase [Egibacter rhizosphaerae]